jgi:hypothetical protein
MAGPYELQSPKDIAMEYGGNKQKIAQAAQMGMIDPTAAVLAGMFIDKMRTAQREEMAPQSTVAQDVMAAPQMAAGLGATPQAAMAPQMPQQMPTEAGVAALPVPDEMVPNEFAGGGIIAFANGGVPLDYSQFGDLGEELKRQEELRRLFLGENEALKAEREGMEAAKDEQRAMRLIEAGLGIAGGQSPYALQNIATGALPAVKGYGEDVKTQRKRETELAGMDRAERAKVLEAATGAVQAREKLVPETIREARLIQDEARKAGKKVPSLEEAIKSIEKRNTTTLQSAFVNARTSAAKAVGDLINSSTFAADVKRVAKSEGPEAAEAYRQRKIRETVGLFPGVDLTEVMAVLGGGTAAAPTAAPARPKPTLSKFLEAARKANPGVSDGELTKFYNQKYGQ